MHKSTLDLPEHVGAIEEGGGRKSESLRQKALARLASPL
jgi:hypothetical protein